MDIAIFGGSFNPVHFGHFEIVRQVDLQFNFSKILVVPAYKNPLKEDLPSIPENVRLQMLVETFLEFKNVEISSFELNESKTSYSYNTLEHFRKQYPEDRFYLILGKDAFASFHLWANADKISELCTLLVFNRQGAELTIPDSTGHKLSNVHWVEAKIPKISASEIRHSTIKTIKQEHWLHPNALKTWEQFVNRAQ